MADFETSKAELLMIDPDFSVVTLEGKLDTAFQQKIEEDLVNIISKDKRPIVLKLPNTVH